MRGERLHYESGNVTSYMYTVLVKVQILTTKKKVVISLNTITSLSGQYLLNTF